MKKKKRVLTKQQRNAILQSLGRNDKSVFVVNSNKSESQVSQTIPTAINTSILTHNSQIKIDSSVIINEIKKIAVVGAVIVFLLIGAIVINQKTDYLLKIGSIITKNVGL